MNDARRTHPAERSPGGPSRRDVELAAWCETNELDPADADALHVQAFLGGYDAGFEDGWEDGDEHATEYLRDGGTLR